MNFDKLFGHSHSVDLPTGAMLGAGVVLLLITLKMRKFMTKVIVGLLGLGLVAGAWWWHLHRQ